MRSFRYAFVCIILIVLMINNCGGCSAAPVASLPLPGLDVEGTVEAPSSSATGSSLIKGSKPLYVTQTGVQVDFNIYNISSPPADGESIATGTTNSDGTYSVTLDDVDVNAGDILLLVADNGILGILTMPTPLEDDDTPIAVAVSDFNSTLALEQIKQKLDVSGEWSDFSFDSIDADVDVECLLKLAKEQWKDLSIEESSGLAGSLSILKTLMAGAFAQNDLGSYGSITDMLQAFFDQSVSSSFVSQSATNAASYFGGKASTYQNNWSYSAMDYSVLAEILKLFYAGGEVISEDSSNESFCGLAKDDEEFLSAAIQVLLSATDASSCKQTFGSVGAVNFLLEVFAEYESGDDYDFTNDDLEHLWNAGAFAGLAESLQGNYQYISYTDFIALLDNMPENLDDFDYENWGLALMNIYLDYILNSLSLSDDDIDEISGFAAFQTAAGIIIDINADTYDNYDWRGIYEAAYAALVEAGFDFGTCISDPDACASDYGSTYYMDDWDQYSSRECNYDGTCDSDENYIFCTYDCAYDYYQDIYSGISCGDGSCSGLLEYYSCPSDCLSYLSSSYCGDGTCDSDEDSSSCSYDCENNGYCGDGVCQSDENASSCGEDCDSSITNSFEDVSGLFTMTPDSADCYLTWGSHHQILTNSDDDTYSATNGLTVVITSESDCSAYDDSYTASTCYYYGFNDDAYDPTISINIGSCWLDYVHY